MAYLDYSMSKIELDLSFDIAWDERLSPGLRSHTEGECGRSELIDIVNANDSKLIFISRSVIMSEDGDIWIYAGIDSMA